MNTFTPGGRSDLGGNRAENSFNFFVITKQADRRRIDALNCGVGEDSGESPELQGDPTCPS